MVVSGFESSPNSLTGATVITRNPECFSEKGLATVEPDFSEGSRLRADYWRLIRDGHAITSNFEHQQQYGLPAPTNALAMIAEALDGGTLSQAKSDARTDDLHLSFEGGIELQVFNFTGYEDWEIQFSNGTGEYTNHER